MSFGQLWYAKWGTVQSIRRAANAPSSPAAAPAACLATRLRAWVYSSTCTLADRVWPDRRQGFERQGPHLPSTCTCQRAATAWHLKLLAPRPCDEQ